MGFQKDQSFFNIIVNSIHTHCTWLAENINIWVEGMAVREGLSVLSGIIWEVIYSVGQGNLHLSGKSQGTLRNTSGCGNHGYHRKYAVALWINETKKEFWMEHYMFWAE